MSSYEGYLVGGVEHEVLVQEGHHGIQELGEGARLPGKEKLMRIDIHHNHQQLMEFLCGCAHCSDQAGKSGNIKFCMTVLKITV